MKCASATLLPAVLDTATIQLCSCALTVTVPAKRSTVMKKLTLTISLVAAIEANADLIEYDFVPYNTTGPIASGVVWTDPAFDTIGVGSYFRIDNVNGTGSFGGWLFPTPFDTPAAINPTSAIQSPPYLTPFVLGGFIDTVYSWGA